MTPIETTLFKTIIHIQSEWNLSDAQLRKSIGLTQTEINEARLSKQITKTPRILLFIKFYKKVSQEFSTNQNQLSWLKTTHPKLNKIPLSMIMTEKGLNELLRYTQDF